MKTAEHFFHKPVMLREVIDSLRCRSGYAYVDGTLGGGGHACGILKETDPDGVLVGIDVDEDALIESRKRLAVFGDRAVLVRDNFANIKRILTELHIEKVAGIILDLGVSSHQLEVASRGFSFTADAPLDMRMDQSSRISAYDLVNTLSEEELTKIIREYGEERRARRVARAIIARRKISPVETTGDLAALIANVLPQKQKRVRIHPATKIFQAFRIAVNNELASLHKALADGIDLLDTGGRFSVISFHSLEDRIVKNAFRSWEKGCICPSDFPVCVCNRKAKLRVLTRKPMTPDENEIDSNPRARSARLRTAERI